MCPEMRVGWNLGEKLAMYINPLAYMSWQAGCIVEREKKNRNSILRIKYVKIFLVQIGSKYHTGLH